MSEEKIKNIQKTSKIVLKVTNIAKAICIAVAIIVILAGIIMLVHSDEINTKIKQAVESGELLAEDVVDGMNSQQAMEMISEERTTVVLVSYMIVIGAILICLAVVLHFVGKVFRDFMESYSPFKPEIVKDLKVAFVLITVLSLKSSLLIGLVIGLALWCVVHIFEYGCVLQQQSDETL